MVPVEPLSLRAVGVKTGFFLNLLTRLGKTYSKDKFSPRTLNLLFFGAQFLIFIFLIPLRSS
jgi:hypothetical protein